MITAHHLVFGRKYGGLYLSYNFNGNLNDSSGNGRNATANGTITYGVGRKGVAGTAIQFGSGNIMTPTLPVSSVWSISFWFKTNSTSLVQVMFELSSNFNNTNGLLVDLNDTSPILGKLMAGISSSSSKNLKNTNNTLNDGLWKHIVIILDKNQPVQNEIKIYINNLLSATSTYLGDNSEMSGNFISDKIYIGGRGLTYVYPYLGLIDDFKLYNYPLTQTEITNLYNE